MIYFALFSQQPKIIFGFLQKWTKKVYFRFLFFFLLRCDFSYSFFGVFLSSWEKENKNFQFVVYKYFLLSQRVVIYSFFLLQNISVAKNIQWRREGRENFLPNSFPPIIDDFQWLRRRKEGKTFAGKFLSLSPVAYETNFKHHGKIFKCILDCRKLKRFLRKQKRFCLQQ